MSSVPEPRPRGNISVPDALKSYQQFVVWKLVQKPGKPKPDKLPVNPATGLPASATDPTTWTDYDAACRAYASGSHDGVGFVFTAADPFAFLDLDDCRDPVTGGWLAHANAIVGQLPGAAWETSQSGNGLHGIARVGNKAALGNKARKWADAGGNRFEFYTAGRFIAFGACNWTRPDLSAECDLVFANLVPDRQTVTPGVTEWEDVARPDYAGPADDDELIRRALASKGGLSALDKAASFAALWSANAVELGRFCPDDAGKRQFDHSAADLALAHALAWWTGCNPVRIERIMSRAPLCEREKWQKRGDYRARTIIQAIADPVRAYMKPHDRRAQQLQADIQIGDDVPTQPLPKIMSLEEMERDLVHVGFGSQTIHRYSKTIRAKDDAASEYAASVTEIDTGKTDGDGNLIAKQRQTLELWRRSPHRISVDVLTWRPNEPEICNALETTGSGQRAYNLWTPPRLLPSPDNWHEWVRPFIDHIAYLVPIETERHRFLQWLAHIFQRPGELPHTCYLMIATTTGIGRGTLASMLTRALRGYVAANADVGILLSKSFNGRLSQKLLATVDEIREGGNQRHQQQENFKSAVVEEERNINPKYGRQYVETNCCRWLLFSNHLDALPFDNSDRRVIVIENPITRAQPQWYEYLHKIMNEQAFIGSVQRYLATLDISTFKAGEVAPINAVKLRALQSMEAPADAAARQFAATWTGDLATVADLREFMGDDAPAHSAAMRHVIERAGMRTWEKMKIAGKSQTVLIVRGPLTGDDLEITSNDKIAANVIAAQTAFRALI